MKHHKRIEWIRLDNASKIFPATCNQRDTKVFRIACELYEMVDPELLQTALDEIMENFPLYQVVLRRGFFWYYLESSDIHPSIQMESEAVCAPLYFGERRNLLFRVVYYNKRINLEIFHALSDGTGAIWFMESLVHQYLILKHKESLGDTIPIYHYHSAVNKQKDNSFQRHFEQERFSPRRPRTRILEDKIKAYRIKGSRSDENRTMLLEGAMSVQALLDQAHKHKATLTVFIASLFLFAIYKEMPTSQRERPVVLSIPIDLRQFYESATARNFFSTMNIGYDFGKDSDELEEIIRRVSEHFQQGRDKEPLNDHLIHMASLEKNPFTRIVPLPIKDLSVRMFAKAWSKRVTSALSNVGRINLPIELQPFVRQFSICTSADMPKITMCSYLDRMVISFTSPFRETDIQRTFFQLLSKMEIDIEISSNI